MLHLENITIAYNHTVIVDSLTIQVKDSEIVSIIGPNGAGKSTVLKAIMNLGDTRITSGEILFMGDNIRGITTHQIISKGISYIPQGNAVFTTLSVEENLKIALTTSGNGKTTLNYIYDRFPVLLEKRKEAANKLSGGEKQILGLARALVNKPRLLLLDEPSIGLSPKLSSEVFDRIRTLKREGTSVILIEQKVKEAIAASDRVYILKAGKIYFEGGKDEVQQSEHLKKAYLGG